MLQGVFQRAVVAILLIGALVAPAQICLQHANKTGHACCAARSERGANLHSDCCLVRPTLPAVVVPPAVSASVAAPVTQEFVYSNGLSLPSEITVSAVIPPKSPPTGASILRI